MPPLAFPGLFVVPRGEETELGAQPWGVRDAFPNFFSLGLRVEA